MAYLLIHHKVSDYRHFKSVFDDDAERRRRAGSRGGQLFRSAENPNELVALFVWDNAERARGFARSYELREASEWATAVGEWTATILEQIAEVEA
jgi:hypothetical protein